MSIIIYKDGTFEIHMKGSHISRCFPGIDGKAIRPYEVKISSEGNSHEITYSLKDGVVHLNLVEKEGEIHIRSGLSGFSKMPHWFHPVFQGEIENVSGVYIQGPGMTGPSGYYSMDMLSKQKEIESDGMISIEMDGKFIFFSVLHHERFLNRYHMSQQKENESNMFANAGFRLEEIPIHEVALPDIQIYETFNLQEGLEITARKIAHAMGARTPREPAYHWCSWYYMYQNFSHEDLKNYMEGFSTLTPSVPLKYIQIDAGYFPSAGDWLIANERWPQGLEAAFRDIQSYGYQPAIWIGPYMVGCKSKLYREHPDWILYKNDGSPLTTWTFYGEESVWGLRDQEYYVLDTSHPKAMEYLKMVFRTFKQWGAKLFKTDFMFWGFQDSAEVRRYHPGKTSYEYFRDLLDMIREEIGEESYWLGCIAPFLPFIGYADGMRIAGDVGARWDGKGFGPENMIREVVGCNYFNNVYWQNDPDAIILRDFYTHLTEGETEALAILQAVSGGAIYTSDPLHEISKERLELFRFIKPQFMFRPYVPFLNRDMKHIVLAHKLQHTDKYILFFFNPSATEMVDNYRISDLTGEKQLYVHLWNKGEGSEKRVEEILVRVPSHGCRLYFASKDMMMEENLKKLF